MTRSSNNIRIPLPEDEAVALLGRVKPTEDMPRQGAHPTKPKSIPKKKASKKRAK